MGSPCTASPRLHLRSLAALAAVCVALSPRPRRPWPRRPASRLTRFRRSPTSAAWSAPRSARSMLIASVRPQAAHAQQAPRQGRAPPRRRHGPPQLLLTRFAGRRHLRRPDPPGRVPDRGRAAGRSARTSPGRLRGNAAPGNDHADVDEQPRAPGEHPQPVLPRDRHRRGLRRARGGRPASRRRPTPPTSASRARAKPQPSSSSSASASDLSTAADSVSAGEQVEHALLDCPSNLRALDTVLGEVGQHTRRSSARRRSDRISADRCRRPAPPPACCRGSARPP